MEAYQSAIAFCKVFVKCLQALLLRKTNNFNLHEKLATLRLSKELTINCMVPKLLMSCRASYYIS